MSDTEKTFGFRPTVHEQRLVAVAKRITGKKTSDLLRLCLAKALPSVVRELESTRTIAQKEFETLLLGTEHDAFATAASMNDQTRQDAHATSPGKPDTKTYTERRKRRRNAA